MLIAGFQKTTFVDYPGRIAAAVFTPGCNMRCWYCHNRHILTGSVELIDESEVFDYLERRRGMLDGVVISGGEPTLQRDLRAFIERVRALGYLVKLDTNGTDPFILAGLMADGLLDYVAMDVKAPVGSYKRVTRTDNSAAAIRRSIELLIGGSVDYEFRTTFSPDLDAGDITALAEDISGAKRYYLQQYRKVEPDDPEPHPPSVVRAAAEAARERLGVCEIRGL